MPQLDASHGTRCYPVGVTASPDGSDDDAQPRAPFSAGEILDGKFRIGEVLGRGGMGVVIAAHHLDLDEPVALKFLHRGVASDEVAVARLLREARAVSRINSARVPRVLDVARLADGSPYIVMELLRGSDLDALLRSRGTFGVSEAAHLMMDLCETLEQAHRHGIVHRDLKPQNVFLARDEREGTEVVKVLDFGISRLLTPSDDTAPYGEGLTKGDEILGTPRYVSPEQIMDPRSVDARADVYGVGICLYCMLTGKPPFMARTLPELLREVLTLEAPLVTLQRRDVPAPLAALVRRCLAKDPAARHAGAAELGAALREVLAASDTAHLDDETILAMQDGRLDGPALEAAAQHVAGCADCGLLVAAAAPADQTLTASFAGAPRAANLSLTLRQPLPPLPALPSRMDMAAPAPAPVTAPGRARMLAVAVVLVGLLASGLLLRRGARPVVKGSEGAALTAASAAASAVGEERAPGLPGTPTSEPASAQVIPAATAASASVQPRPPLEKRPPRSRPAPPRAASHPEIPDER